VRRVDGPVLGHGVRHGLPPSRLAVLVLPPGGRPWGRQENTGAVLRADAGSSAGRQCLVTVHRGDARAAADGMGRSWGGPQATQLIGYWLARPRAGPRRRATAFLVTPGGRPWACYLAAGAALGRPACPGADARRAPGNASRPWLGRGGRPALLAAPPFGKVLPQLPFSFLAVRGPWPGPSPVSGAAALGHHGGGRRRTCCCAPDPCWPPPAGAGPSPMWTGGAVTRAGARGWSAGRAGRSEAAARPPSDVRPRSGFIVARGGSRRGGGRGRPSWVAHAAVKSLMFPGRRGRWLTAPSAP